MNIFYEWYYFFVTDLAHAQAEMFILFSSIGIYAIRKIIYLNWGKRDKDMIEHHSYVHNLSSSEIISLKKKFRLERDSNPCMTSPIPLQYSTNWGIKPAGSWSCCELVIYPKMVKNTNEYMRDHIYLNCGDRYEDMIDHCGYILSSFEIKTWKKFRLEWDSNSLPLRYLFSALPTELSSQVNEGTDAYMKDHIFELRRSGATNGHEWSS